MQANKGALFSCLSALNFHANLPESKSGSFLCQNDSGDSDYARVFYYCHSGRKKDPLLLSGKLATKIERQ